MKPTKEPYCRLALGLAYEGSRYRGWQQQQNTGRTLAAVLQEHLEAQQAGILLDMQAAGRTDAGVHARDQVCQLDLRVGKLWTWWQQASAPKKRLAQLVLAEASEGITNFSDAQAEVAQRHGASKRTAPQHLPETEWLALALGQELIQSLPLDLSVHWMGLLPKDYHVRHRACWKRYVYRIFAGPGAVDPLSRRFYAREKESLDLQAMQRAADLLVGRYNAYLLSRAKQKRKSFVRSVYRCEVIEERATAEGLTKPETRAFCSYLDAEQRGQRLSIVVEAEGFLHHMVRYMAGVLIQVGRHEVSLDELRRLLLPPLDLPWESLQQERASLLTSWPSSEHKVHRGLPLAPAEGLCLELVSYSKWPGYAPVPLLASPAALA